MIRAAAIPPPAVPYLRGCQAYERRTQFQLYFINIFKMAFIKEERYKIKNGAGWWTRVGAGLPAVLHRSQTMVRMCRLLAGDRLEPAGDLVTIGQVDGGVLHIPRSSRVVRVRQLDLSKGGLP